MLAASSRSALLISSSLLLRSRTPCSPLFDIRCMASVSGNIYEADSSAPTVKLFTKAGCTLCDVAKEVLTRTSEELPHTLEAVDITDADNAQWFDKYKYDIPVLHIDDKYWAKHRITDDEAREALAAAQEQRFEAQRGEPDAARLERKKNGPLR